MLAEAPLGTRIGLTVAWQSLGLRLGSPRSDRLVLGWPIRCTTDEFALLGADGQLGLSAELLFEPLGDTMLFATFVQLDNTYMRGLWPRVIPAHLKAVRGVLERAHRRNQLH
jgi:hypothetical protein